MASKSPSLDPIYRWLRHVDEQISPGENVDFLKFALYPFLKIDLARAQGLKTPSEVYNFLLEKCFQRNKEKTFQLFTHALNLLGGDQRGDYLVSANCLSHYGISSPSALAVDKMDPESKFFDCLTTIARKARGYNLEEGLKERFAKKRFLNVNPRHVKHLPDLFIRLVQNRIIAPTNTYHLLRALRKLGSKRATQCLVYLNEYHKSVGLDEIEEVKGIKKEPPTTAFENTDRDTSDFSVVVPRRLVKTSKRYKYRQPARDEHKVGKEGDIDESLKTLDLSQDLEESEAISTSDSENSSVDESDPITIQPTLHTRHKRSVLCGCWILTIAVALALSGGLCGAVWRNLFTQKFGNVIIYDKTAVVLTELDQFYYSQLKLLGYFLGDRVLQIYRFNSSCDELPTNDSIIHWHKSNTSEDQNYTHQYLLPGSTISYTISLVDNDSVRVVDTAPATPLNAELETVKGYGYITRGPERQEFDPTNCLNSPDCKIVYHKPFTYNHNNSYLVDVRDYYNFHSIHSHVPSVPQYRYTLDLIVKATTADLNQAQHVCNITDVNEGEESCNINFQFKFKTSYVCLVAYTEYEENSRYSYTILDIEVTKQLKLVLLLTAVPPAAILLLVFVCLISCTIKFCCCRKTTRYTRVSLS